MTDVPRMLDALTTSTRSLEHTVAELTDEQARGDSLLPGWSRGHVLTHIARNSDAIINLATWAKTGVETPMYASRESRNADIEAGSGRSAAELVADVRDAHERMMALLDDMPEEAWDHTIRWGSRRPREDAARLLPKMRRIEVEVHNVDLDLAYTLAHWPDAFVTEMLTDTSAEFTAREGIPGFVLVDNDTDQRWTVGVGGPEISGPRPALLGWLIGRTDGTGLHAQERLPDLGVWR